MDLNNKRSPFASQSHTGLVKLSPANFREVATGCCERARQEARTTERRDTLEQFCLSLVISQLHSDLGLNFGDVDNVQIARLCLYAISAWAEERMSVLPADASDFRSGEDDE